MIKLNSQKKYFPLNPVIYFILNTSSGRGYIGQATNLYSRMSSHVSTLKRNSHSCIQLQRAFNKYSIDVFVVMILENLENNEYIKDGLTLAEQFWMNQVHSKWLYNTAPAAGSSLGIIRSAETRARNSMANKGKHLTQEHKDKIGDSNRGKTQPPPTDEARGKMRSAKLGLKYTDSHKRNIGKAHLGKKRSPEAVAAMTAAQYEISVKLSKNIEYGTSRIGKRFRSIIYIDGKLKHLGMFDTQEEAHNVAIKTKFPEIYYNVVAPPRSPAAHLSPGWGTRACRSGNFESRALIDGKRTYLGTFDTQEGAHFAALAAKFRNDIATR